MSYLSSLFSVSFSYFGWLGWGKGKRLGWGFGEDFLFWGVMQDESELEFAGGKLGKNKGLRSQHRCKLYTHFQQIQKKKELRKFTKSACQGFSNTMTLLTANFDIPWESSMRLFFFCRRLTDHSRVGTSYF